MPTFPSYAKILRDGFAEQRESALMRTEMESGPPKQAKVKSRVMLTRPVSIRLDSKADYLSFVEWFKTDLAEGSAWFSWADPVSGSTLQVRFVGGGLDAYPVAALGAHWVIRGLKIEGWGV